MLRWIAPLALAAVFATSCKDKKEPAADTPAKEPKTAAKNDSGDVGSPENGASKSDPLSFAREHVGPLSGTAKAELGSLGALFPEHRIVESVETYEGESYPVYEIFSDKEMLYSVDPGPDGLVGTVTITSAKVKGPRGVGIGTDYATFRGKIKGALECNGGAEEFGEDAMCIEKGAPQLMFVFALGHGKHYANPIADDKIAATLKNKKIRQIIWTPPAD